MTTAQRNLSERAGDAAVGIRLDRRVSRPSPKRIAILAQIEACRREVANWPERMLRTGNAPKWMEGWDDI